MNRAADISLLAYALLGLLQQQPRSGYDLRKMFATTPMTTFSDSPGAIYPALTRLERAGLVRGQVQERAGLRRRRLYHLTRAGVAELQRWLAQPVTRDEVVRRIDQLMLRFGFMDQALGRAASQRLLKEFHREVAAFLPTLHQYFAATRAQMPLSGALALESGIRSYETLLRWSRTALAAYGHKAMKKGA